MGGVDRTRGGVPYSLEKEVEPGLPVTGITHGVQQPVVLGPVLLEIQAQVKKWLPKHPVMMQKKGDQQPAHPAVAIEEGVNGFELHVGKGGLD